ncbi:MAG TPA: hypothetical protein VNK23_04960 [Candidatus Dormibacteraeota bacterium]|nr:hypothetical protein [Candidatus Dormibacteraeota bacterium]
MKLSVRALTLTVTLLGGGCILCVGLAHLAVPSYASHFLAGIASVYPDFRGGRSFGDVIVGTGYALVDGALGVLISGWLYNVFAAEQPPVAHTPAQER